VAPAAHYLCGGIVADLDGATSLPGLWVAGEAACNGVHGANRLASNSLLDGMVFGPRVVEAVRDGRDGPRPTGAMRCVLAGDGGVPGRPVALPPWPGSDGAAVTPGKARARLQQAMTVGAGVLRSDESLRDAADVARSLLASPGAGEEVRNLATVAEALAVAARERRESRGAHARTDFPEPDPALRARLVLSRAGTSDRRQ
jgi:L-aspartate oxidase